MERQFEIIGEALRQALDRDAQLTGRISGTHRIIAFRNRLIHGYATVSDEVVWGIVESKLPALHREVVELLREAEGPA